MTLGPCPPCRRLKAAVSGTESSTNGANEEVQHAFARVSSFNTRGTMGW
jgi:hypothetical protein